MFPPVLIAWASVQAETLGRKKCAKTGVGALIRKLKEGIPENGSGRVVGERREAAQLLESHCRVCGKCRGHMGW